MTEYNILKKLLKTVASSRRISVKEISKRLKVKEDFVRGIVETLRKEGAVKIERKTWKIIKPGPKLLELKTLPEIKILKYLLKKRKVTLRTLFSESGLSNEDVQAGIGKLVTSRHIKIEKTDGERVIKVNVDSLPRDMLEIEKFIHKLLQDKERKIEDFSDDELEILNRLVSRPKFIEVEEGTTEYVLPTEKTRVLLEEKIVKPVVTRLTPDIILGKKWDDVVFKKYDLNEEFFRIYPGRIHPLRELIREIREIFVSMGFEEAHGPLVEVAFINFDMLFQPQDHPARDMQDTFYLLNPEYGEIEYPKEVIDRVRKTHENGWKTGSIGWGGRWSIEEARRLVLRTHTTSVSITKVYEIGEKPAKIFSIGRVFRNETVDYKHLAEFMQIDGIVINKKANLRELMGIIKEFYSKLGFKDVRFWPSYFPYTEPSIQPSIYVKKWGKWLELGGAGIFRPEVTIPLGVKWPVLAWGLGVERLLMIRYDIDDIRTIYNNNLNWLRNIGLKV